MRVHVTLSAAELRFRARRVTLRDTIIHAMVYDMSSELDHYESPNTGAVAKAGRELKGAPVARNPEQIMGLMTSAGATAEMVRQTGTWFGLKRSANTQAAYARDVSWWMAYATASGVNIYSPKPTDADDYFVALRAAGLAESTIARRLSTASSWYRHMIRAQQVATASNPFEGMQRPKLKDESETRGLSAGEVAKLLGYTREHADDRTHALLTFLATTAARVGAALAVKRSDVVRQNGHDAVWMLVKGGDRKLFKVPPMGMAALERVFQAGRDRAGDTDYYLFATSAGKPWDRGNATRALWTAATQSGVMNAGEAQKLSAHSFRHSYATIALSNGAPLADVQDAMGHSDPKTTRRYDRARGKLERSPANLVEKMLNEAAGEGA